MSENEFDVKVPASPEDFKGVETAKMVELFENLDPAKQEWVYETAGFMLNSQGFGDNVKEFIDTIASRFGKKEKS